MKKPPIGSIIQQGNHAYRVTEHPITSTPEHKIRVIGLHGKPKGKTFSITWDGWTYFRHLDEHFAVCHDCNELMPCSGMKAQREVEKTVKAMQIPDGFCPSCSEPITSSQEKTTLPRPQPTQPTSPGRGHIPPTPKMPIRRRILRKEMATSRPGQETHTTHPRMLRKSHSPRRRHRRMRQPRMPAHLRTTQGHAFLSLPGRRVHQRMRQNE